MSPELWIVYTQTSRAGKPATAQLVELERPDGCRLVDLEDVLDYVVSQGFVDVQHRPMCWWESCHGERLSASRVVLDLVASGNGHCPEHALKLVIADIPTAVWVRYVYLHTPRAHTATQRIRLGHPHCAPHEHLAHITNYIFARGYLPARQRACVYWETPCGRRVGEETRVHELLAAREGTTEEHALRLVIDL